jgi:ribosome-binding factor A
MDGAVRDAAEMRQFKRSQRLSEQMLRDISLLLERELSEYARGLVTFTQVRLTDDLRYAKVYYSYLGPARIAPASRSFSCVSESAFVAMSAVSCGYGISRN